MKRLLLLLTVGIFGLLAEAQAQNYSQDVIVTNNSCDHVTFYSYVSSPCGGPAGTAKSVQYVIAPGGSAQFSTALPGGFYPPLSYINYVPGTIPPPIADFFVFFGFATNGGSGTSYEYSPCSGFSGSSSFTSNSCGTINMTVTWSSSGPNTVDFN